MGKLVNDDALYEKVTNIATDAEQAAKTARAAAESARTAIEGLKGGPSSEGPLQSIARDLKQTLASTRDTMANLADNTEALKRSFLVRGYFRERGYYDLDAITAVDYRQGALAGEHREPIRIWLRGDLLFETAAAVCPPRVPSGVGWRERRPGRRFQKTGGPGSTVPWPKFFVIRRTHHSSSKATPRESHATCGFFDRRSAPIRSESISSHATGWRRRASAPCRSVMTPPTVRVALHGTGSALRCGSTGGSCSRGHSAAVDDSGGN